METGIPRCGAEKEQTAHEIKRTEDKIAAWYPADKATVSGIQPLAEGDFSWAGCVTVRGRLGREL